MYGIGSELNAVYEKLNTLFPMKLTPQFKNSELRFQCFYEVRDLATDQRWYQLILEDKPLKFHDLNSLYKELLAFTVLMEKELNEEFHELNRSSAHDRFVDDNQVYMDHERIGQMSGKLSDLNTAIRKKLSMPARPREEELRW